MAKHLAPRAARRAAQQRRRAIRMSMSAGTAVLAAYASGMHGDGSMSASHVSETPDSATVKMTAGSVAAAAGARAAVLGPVSASGAVAVSAAVSAPVSAPVSASANASLSYSRSVVFTAAKESTRKLDASSFRSRRPATGTLMSPLEVLHPSSAFGLRKSPITGEAGEFHWGRDFAAACGTRVYSVDAGVVRAVGWHQWGGGNRVEVDHGNGLITTYNHLEGIGVRKGESVQAGDLIAKVGTTGASTGCHLHFETILNGSHTDPEEWTLVPLNPAEPAADVTMTDYRKPGTAKDTPSWAVPAAGAHNHEVGHDEHESPQRKAAKAPTRSKSRVSAAAASSPAKKTAAPAKPGAPAKPATPVETPARAPRAVQPAPAKSVAPSPRTAPSPAPSPTKTAAPAPAVAPKPTSSPSAVPSPAPSPTKTAAPAPAVAPKPTSSPSAAPTSAPASVPVPARNVMQKPSTEPDTATTAVPTTTEAVAARTNG